MAFSTTGSAIDDSFDPTFFPAQPGVAGSSHGSDGPGTFNGPRSGHWTVGSTVGSAIDDRCPTIWGSSAGIQDRAQTQTHAQPIAGSLLRKLGKASLEKQVALAAERTTQETVKDEASRQGLYSAAVPTTRQDAQPKGFYLPRMKDARGVDIAKKSSQDKLAREALLSKAQNDTFEERARPSQASHKPEKAPSHVSEAREPNSRMVRITGKDGQEAFFELPILPKPISRPASVVAGMQTPRVAATEKRPAKGANPQKTKQDRRAKQRSAATEMAAMAEMSGALPPSQTKQHGRKAEAVEVIPWKTSTSEARLPVVKAPSVASLTKDSGVGFGGLNEANASEISAQPSKAPTVKSLQAAVQSISKNSKTPSNHSFQGAGEDWVNASGGKSASQSHHSRPASAVPKSYTSQQYIHSMAAFGEAKPTSIYAPSDPGTERPAFEQARNDNSPTVFAGRGWISPHPLSRSPSAFASPPQSHISLPKDIDFQGGGQMTYDEWQAMQPAAQRRNYSRTESVMSHRVQAVAASIARGNGSHATAMPSAAGSRTYHQPTMESEHEHNNGSSPSQVPQRRQTVKLASARSASAASASLKSASRNGGQAAHWSSQASNAKGWDTLPQFDGSCDERPSPSEHATAAYEKQLQSIVAQSSPREANYQQWAGDTERQPCEVQLDMPWDRSHSSRSSSRTQSHGSLQRSIIKDTPPSAAGYSPAPSVRGGQTFHGSRTSGSSRNPASSSLRMYDSSGSVQYVDGDEPSPLSSGPRSSSGGFEDLNQAERGYGGY